MIVVNVRNTGKVPVSFDLYHVLYCEISRDCRCDIQRILRPVAQKTGEVKTQYDRVVSARGIYLAPGQSIELHPAVKRLQPVQNLIAKGLLEVKTVEKTLTTAATTPETVVKKPHKSQSDKKKSDSETTEDL
jgi:hypothetical protein